MNFMNYLATMNAAIKSDEKFSRMDKLDHPMEVFFFLRHNWNPSEQQIIVPLKSTAG